MAWNSFNVSSANGGMLENTQYRRVARSSEMFCTGVSKDVSFVGICRNSGHGCGRPGIG
jgi:hypothetical protein